MNHSNDLLQYYVPATLSKKQLDRYLAAGWFRSGNMLFRAKVTCFENNLYTPINIRIRLADHAFSKSQRQLYNRNQKLFRYEIRKATITEDKEWLFREQQQRFRSFLSHSLEEFMAMSHRFDTHEVAVYDEDRLVALSFFDIGHNSIMSLLGLFDQSYSKYSLGIYTMLVELQYGIDTGRQWYYPGYVHEVPSVYDYKLKLGKCQIFDWDARRWKYDIEPTQVATKAMDIKLKISKLTQNLKKENVDYQTKIYIYFGWPYYDATYFYLVKYPILVLLTDGRVLTYDDELGLYVCIKLELYLQLRDINMVFAPDFDHKVHYTDAMKVAETLFETTSIKRLVEYVLE
jgi:arginine-tRNA-protein transferase